MKKIFTSIIILITLFSAPIHAQLGHASQSISVSQYEKKATEAFEKKDFNKALEYYQIILTDAPSRTDLYWNTAQAARGSRHYIVADRYYELLAKTDMAKSYPQLAYYRGLTKKSVGNYDMAIDLLKSYAASSSTVSAKGVGSNDVQNEIDASEWAKGIVATPLTYEVERLNKKVNTFYTDIAPVQYGNSLYYTTAFFPEDKTKKPVTHIYSAPTDLSKESTPLAINSEVDGEYTAQYALNTEGSRIYYNICKQLETGEYRCEIFSREKDNTGNWKEAVRLPDTINTQNFTASQPHIGLDKATGKELLYFVSDRPGGKGGLDIWTADIEANGSVGVPKNLSSVNTAKDDITPYYYKDADVLFFSSEGYKSLGGLDVYYVTKNGDSWSTPVNGGYPLNSSYDDMYYTINNGRAYFTSNRKGGMCASEEKDCICNDIYKYDIKVDLKAETFLASDNSNLKGCKMELLDMETGKVISFNVNDMGNDFAFPLDLTKKYSLIASKAGHRSDTVAFDTKGIWTTTTLFKKLSLQPNLKLNVYVFDDKSVLNGAKVEMREASSGKLIASENLTGNLFTYNNLEFGKSYWLYGYKDTYTSDSSLLTIDAYGSSMRYVYTDSLYLMAFKGGLPITLYFDNDHPNPRTRDTFSYLTYGETYNAYFAKQPEYLRNYYKSTKEISSVEAGGITEFFVNTIKGNYDKLNLFSEQLYRYMQAGKTFEIVVEGYASPLAPNDYNQRLTSRRISSLINHLYEFNGGVLRPYLISKTLNIRILPFGEEKSDKTVSDSPKDRRQSVYSVAAMKERKIEIKEINSMDKPNALGSIQNLQIGDLWNIQNYSLALGSHASELFNSDGSRTWTAKGIESNSTIIEKNAKGLTGKQRHEVVMMDVYTGDVIKKGGSIEVYNENKKISQAKNKGDFYRYEIQLGQDLTAKIGAAGYNSYSMKHFSSNTEGGVVIRDTVYLTPFSNLPLALYFNNDRPDGNKKKDKTLSSYEKSYKDFYAQKKDFVKNFNQILAKEGTVPSANNQMEAFFANDVKGGYENLEGSANVMEIYLKKGYELEIIIEGYASPLANSDYNEYLTNRRIQSVINYLTSSSSTIKKAYKAGKFKVGVRPLGESHAPTGVSDDSNAKQSIYSIEASRERRVVIKDILIRNNNLYKE
jgi:outer membrane protein OmpA-like peptidoglycan-associated protein